MQIVADPRGFPVWSSPVEPGSVHDIASARAHCLGALYKSAADAVRQPWPRSATRAPGCGVHMPIKGRNLDVENQSYNVLLTAMRAIGENANAELKQRWRCLWRSRLCPTRIGTIVAAAIVHSTLQRGADRARTDRKPQ